MRRYYLSCSSTCKNEGSHGYFILPTKYQAKHYDRRLYIAKTTLLGKCAIALQRYSYDYSYIFTPLLRTTLPVTQYGCLLVAPVLPS